MAGNKKQELTTEQRIAQLEGQIASAMAAINHMQRLGGFTDAKTLQLRCHHIEQRLDIVEIDAEMLKDTQAASVALMDDHLRDRHDSDVDRDSSVDATMLRKIRHRLKRWAEDRGLWQKRNGVREARQQENRLRPISA